MRKIILTGTLLLLGATLYGQATKPPTKPQFQSKTPVGEDFPKKPTGKDDKYLYPWANYATYAYNDKKEEVVTLTGNVTMYYQETTFTTQKAVYNRTTQIGEAPGKVTVEDPRNTMTGGKGTANYAKKRAEIVGGVTLVTKPKSTEGKKDLDGPVTMTCDKVIYDWKNQIATPSGNITFKFKMNKKDWVFTCKEAQYDSKNEKLNLKKEVLGISADKESIPAEAIYLDLKEDAKIVMTLIKTKDGRILVEEKGEKEELTTPIEAPPPPPTETEIPLR